MRNTLGLLFLALAMVAAGCAVAPADGQLRTLSAAETNGDAYVPMTADVLVATAPTTTPHTTTSTTSTTSPPITAIPVNPACDSLPELAPVRSFATTALHDRLDEALEHPNFDNVDLSFSVWVDGLGEVATHDRLRKLAPASNQKILVAIAANETLDLEATLRTSFERVGTDLVIRAAADPTISAGRLSTALDAVAASELSFDRLVIDVSAYPQAPRADGWFDWQIPRWVGPISSFMIDNNRWTQSPQMVNDPDTANGERVLTLLAERGVPIDTLEIATTKAPPAGQVLATIDSAPIGNLVRAMLLSSDNQHADLLLMELGRAAAGRGTLSAGGEAIDSVLDARCIPTTGDTDDGSGISRGNQRSAQAFVQTLLTIHSTPEGELLRSQLPIGGVSGTLSRRFTGPYSGRVQAKTGTISDGRALSGWAVTAGGRDVIFSAITHGEGEDVSASLSAIDGLVKVLLDFEG